MISVSGMLKPLPQISASDISFLDSMVALNVVPYRNIPEAPCKTLDEIRSLGRTLFPFTPHSFQLALSVYDWTTASFLRMVLFKIFEYSAVAQHPRPLDLSSIAQQIWRADWGAYNSHDEDFMRSFLMKPAKSLQDVEAQLQKVAPILHQFSDVQNRVLSAACQALPRTSTFAKPRLFSGQIDISQMTLDQFGVEFEECPRNKGPVGEPLTVKFSNVLETYVSKGKTITTKMVWAFTDSFEMAMEYSNGILLIADAPQNGPAVWETTAYVTPLSTDPEKYEYTFMPGSQFEVTSVDRTSFKSSDGGTIIAIYLKPIATKNDNWLIPPLEDYSQSNLISRDSTLSRIKVSFLAVLLFVFVFWTISIGWHIK